MAGNQTASQMIGKFWLFIIANIKSSKQKGVRCKLVLRSAMINCIYKLKIKLFIVLTNSLQVPPISAK